MEENRAWLQPTRATEFPACFYVCVCVKMEGWLTVCWKDLNIHDRRGCLVEFQELRPPFGLFWSRGGRKEGYLCELLLLSPWCFGIDFWNSNSGIPKILKRGKRGEQIKETPPTTLLRFFLFHVLLLLEDISKPTRERKKKKGKKLAWKMFATLIFHFVLLLRRSKIPPFFYVSADI